MTIELFSLVATAALLLVLALISGALYGKQIGNKALGGNRENLPAATGAAGRAQRAHRNLIENALPFAIVVLIAHVMQISTFVTQAAALVFLSARLLHALVYIVGITRIRTPIWFAGVAANFAVAVPLLL